MNNSFSQIDWSKGDGLIPAVIQDASTKQILMLGYMNQKSLEKTLESKLVWFYSRSKDRLWMKGETSGNSLELEDIQLDCDADTLLIKVKPQGPTCHNGTESCFTMEKESDPITELYQVIRNRKQRMPKGSYTSSLFAEGLEKICEKVEEESEEVIRAAKSETKQRLIEESVDVAYHLMVLLVEKGVTKGEIEQEMIKRRRMQ